jgi:hypothetical protein
MNIACSMGGMLWRKELLGGNSNEAAHSVSAVEQPTHQIVTERSSVFISFLQRQRQFANKIDFEILLYFIICVTSPFPFAF